MTAPTIDLPADPETTEDFPVVFSTAAGNAIVISDADSPSLTVSLAADGVLTLSGTAGLTFTSGSNGSYSMSFTGSLADINAALDGLVYTPDPDIWGSGEIDITADDGTDQTTVSLFPTIDPVNDAPVLTPFAANLTAIASDNHNPTGVKIAALLGSHVEDPDNFSAPRGIAVTDVTATGGTWQYSTNNGSTWTNFPSGISGSAALVLRDTYYIRFLPDGTSSGNESFTFRAWDQTDGSTGGTQVDITATGGATAFSAASDIVHLIVNTQPKLQSIAATDASPTNAAHVHFTVTFTAPVTGVDASQFLLSTTGGITGASISDVSGSGSTYVVTVDTGTGDGGVVLNVKGSGIHDLVGNSYTGGMFEAPATFSAGFHAWSLAMADFNGDGKADVVTADEGDSTLGIMLGNGDGTLQARVFVGAVMPLGVAVGDLNGDGKVDLIATNWITTTISTLLGNGDGTFQAKHDSTVGATPTALATGDFNGDHKLDVVVANNGTNTLSLLLGNGDGTFAAASSLSAGSNPVSVVVNDVNADGKLDIVSATAGGQGKVLLGNGDGTFTLASSPMVGAFSRAVALGDLNGDGKLDMIAADNVALKVDVLLGNGDGTFQTRVEYAAGATPYSLSVGDVNGDGKLDVVVANNVNGGTVSILLGNGNGSLQAPLTALAGNSPTSAILGDLNGDGQLDLVVANQGDSTVMTFLNGGAGYTIADLAPTLAAPAVASTNEDTPIVLATANGTAVVVADADNTTLTVSVSAAHGALTLAQTTGLSFSAGDGAGDAAMTFSGTLADINAALDGMTYTPGAGYNGLDTIALGTTDGRKQDSKSIAVTIAAVSDAPAGADKHVTVLEDHAFAFSPSDFGFSDPGDSPANALMAVEITTLPLAGVLTLNGVAVTAGQSIAVADVAGGLLVFTPAADAHGAGAAAFTFQVQDDGGTANGGADTDATPNTITVDVTPVNDAPAGTSGTVTTAEDTAYVFGAADFGFSDTHDSPANALLAVKITTLPAAGTLTDNGVAVTAGQVVTIADITGGKLVFTPDADANGGSYAAFTFQVQDDGGVANGGVDLDPTPRTITVAVTAVNDAPVVTGAGSTQGYTEGSAAVTLEPGLTVSDIDSATLVGATVSLSGFFAGDELKINGTTSGDIVNGGNTIHYSYDSGAGTFTLSGSDTVADYQAALRLVTYDSTSANPTDLGALPSRDVSWTVDDGSVSNNHSVPVDTTINVTAVDTSATARGDAFVTDMNTAIGAALDLFADNGSGADSDPDGGPAFSITAVNGVGASVGTPVTLSSGARLTLNADGTFAYDPNGAFDSLHLASPSSGAANSHATDSFTYTITGGSTASVTVTIDGVDTADTVYQGASGDDTIHGDLTRGHLYHLEQGGDDHVTGGNANDGFYFGGAFNGSDHVDGGAGSNDQIGLEGDYSGGVTLDGAAVTGVEALAMLQGFNYKITTLDNFVGAGQTFTFWSASMGAANHVDLDGSAELDGKFRFFLGQGSDVARGGAGDDLFYGEGGQDTLIGNGGADTFAYLQVSDSTGNANGTAFDTLDFDAANDRIDLPGTVTGIDAAVSGALLRAASFDGDLAAAIGAGQLRAGHAALFNPTGPDYAGATFLIVDANGAAGYQAGADYVFEIASGAGLSTSNFI